MEQPVLVGLANSSHIFEFISYRYVVASDVDECAEDLHNCSLFENKTCSNTNGSFECVCYDGYEELGDCVGMYSITFIISL